MKLLRAEINGQGAFITKWPTRVVQRWNADIPTTARFAFNLSSHPDVIKAMLTRIGEEIEIWEIETNNFSSTQGGVGWYDSSKPHTRTRLVWDSEFKVLNSTVIPYHHETLH